MQVARTTLRLCAVLLTLSTYLGCGSSKDEDDAPANTGGSTGTSTGTKATGGRTGTTGGASSTKAPGGATSTSTGGSAATTGGAATTATTSTAVTTGGVAPVTGGASSMGGSGVVTTGGASAATGGAGTGGATAVLTFNISGTVTGLTGSGLVLQNNSGDDIAVTAAGAFVFPTKIASGQTYTVTVKTQPSNPAQTCTVSGGSGTVANANVSSVAVNCGTDAFTVGGTVSGLDGTGLVLQNNAGDDIAVTANGTFAFATPVLSGYPFAVTVKTQPSEKAQTCVVTGGTGTIAAGNVNTVSVECTTNKYKVKGTIAGLVGSGLVLQNNLGDNLPVTANGEFMFATSVASGAPYSVTVLDQPNQPTQECVVASGAGTVTNADIASVAITCTTSTFTVGGTVVGLVGTGLVLRNNGADDLTMDADGTFTFTTKVASGSPFAVTVGSAPQGAICSVAGGVGTMGSGPVTSVTVNCSDEGHTVSGTVTGLAGNGLRLALNGGNIQSVFGNQFAFTDLIAKDGPYEVTVSQQPTNPWQTCTLTNGSGTIGTEEVTNVQVTCTTNSYAVGGTVNGLNGSGLTLQNNLGDDITITANSGQPVTFAFPTAILSGQAYSATIKTQPSSPVQTCTISQAAGNVAGAAITNIKIDCTTNRYPISGTISGLTGTVVLANGTDTKTLTANGAFTFDNDVESGAAYNIVVQTQPTGPSQTCTVTGGTGTVVDSAITGVAVTCVTDLFSIGGTVTGLASGETIVLQNNGGDDVTINADGTFAFATKVQSDTAYAVTLLSGPTTQQCTLSGAVGTVGAGNVTTVLVNCSTFRTLSGTVTGLLGSGLKILNGSEELTISGDGAFSFTTLGVDGDDYAVSVSAQPTSPAQTCAVTNGSGTFAGDVSDVTVACTTNSYNVKVNVTGLAGSGLVLQNNSANNLSVAAPGGEATFAAQVVSGGTYNVTVLTQPGSPVQTCLVTSPTGTVGSADVTVAVACTTNKYLVGGTVYGNVGTGLVLKNNAGDDLTISASGTFQFATPIDSGAAYAVTVGTQPTGITCGVIAGTGNVGSGAVSTVKVYCPGYTFDYNTQGFYTYNAPTGTTVAWSETEGSPAAGSISVPLAFSATACNSGVNIGVSASPTVDTSALTTMALRIRVDGAWPTTDRSGGFQLYIQDSDTFNNSGVVVGTASNFTSWWALSIGQWQEIAITLPTDANLDRTQITGFGLSLYNGANPSICQSTTILIDSVTFQ